MKKLQVLIPVALLFAAPCFAVPSLTDATLEVRTVVSGLSSPTTMAFIDSDDVLVLQKKDGKVRRVIGGVLQPGQVLDVAVDFSSERGLLGIALHPDFPSTPSVYLYYTESNTGSDSSGAAAGNRVYRYTWTGSQLVSPTLILHLPVTSGPNHNGGVIIFGPDDKLYVVIGDLNRNGRLQNFASGPAPDDTSVILRLNADGTVPGDNPFAAQGGNLRKYYAYGIRNSFGMTFDPLTEKLWMTENGPDVYDEINLVEAGFNSGWEQIMGPNSRDPQGTGDLFALSGSHYSDPEFSWKNPVGPTGLVFLNSTALGLHYQNDLFVGDINNGTLYRFVLNGPRTGFNLTVPLADMVADSAAELNQVMFGTGFGGISDLKVGPDGLLYVVSLGAGKIYVVQPATSPPLGMGVSGFPEAEVGVAYSASFDIVGGVSPYALTVSRGSLPEGLIIDSQGISGTPKANGRASFTARVTDSAGASVSKKLKIKVNAAISIATRVLLSGTAGKPYRARLRAKQGKQPYHWSVEAGALPSGLSLNPATGRIEGTPASAGVANIVIEVSDPLGGSTQKAFTLVIK